VPAASLRVERIDSAEALSSLMPEWQGLARAHGRGLPFATWEWTDAWWRNLRQEGRRVRDTLFVRAFRAPSGKLVGIAPLVLTRRTPLPALTVRSLDFVGADPNLTELRGLLCDPQWETPVHGALLAHLSGCGGDWDCATWRGLRLGSAGHRAVAERSGVRVFEEVPNHVLPLPASWDSFLSSRPRNVKESVRKGYNSLRREGHSFTFEAASSPREVSAALGRFLELHRARAELRSGVQHRDVFTSSASQAFLRDVCTRLAARGEARVFELRIAGRTVATRIGFTIGDTIYLYYSGYDPAWGRYSVMTTTLAEIFRYAIASGFRTVNLSTGDDVSKTRWRPDRIVYLSATQPSPSLRGRMVRAAYGQARRVLLAPPLRELGWRLLGGRRHQSWLSR
jgi:CelD/BcsL family acetyltransferase involved in cellulose biosynthesis